MGTREIWPANHDDKIIPVEEMVYKTIESKIRAIQTGGRTTDSLWELVRLALNCDREERAKRDRHAKGDYGPELEEMQGIVSDITYRTDGDTYSVANRILDKVEEMRAGGFLDTDADRLLEMHQELTAELLKTNEIAGNLKQVIRSLKGDS